MANLCECGKLHYSLEHYFAVHGEYLPVEEHRTQVEVFEDGKIADFSKIKDNQEIPPTIIKWACKTCGNFNTTSNPASHKSNCKFIKYLKFRETVPYKKTTPPPPPSYSPTPKTPKKTFSEKPKEKPIETPPPPPKDDIKKTLAGWSKVRGITFPEFRQLSKIADPNKEYTLDELKALLPPKTPKPDIFFTPPSTRPPSPLPFEEESEPWIRDGKDWSTIDLEFKSRPELIDQWSPRMDYDVVRDWINIGLKLTDGDFAYWLRMKKKLEPEEVQNFYDRKDLERQYKEYLFTRPD